MSTSKLLRAGVALGSVLAVASGSHLAHAIACNDPSLPNPIYLVGGSAPLPIFQQLGAALSAVSPPITLIYQSSAGCAGVNAIISPSSAGLTGNATYLTGGIGQTCTFPTPGPNADLGVAGTYATSCPGVSTLPAGVGDFLGPIQAYDFVVPSQSSQLSISAQAAYFTFGFGASGQYAVSPWTTPEDIITRTNQSEDAILLSLALGVPLGLITSSSFNVEPSEGKSVSAAAALNATTPEAGLGFVSQEVAQAAAANTINVLAYQHYGQSCGWLPSSTSTLFDQINVRTGLYALWANIHFIANVNGSNVPTDANAAQVIGWFQDTVTPPTGVDVDAITASTGGVLDCAMEVMRTSDAGPLLPYAPAAPCDCFFEANATGSTTCATCTSNATCPANAPNCRKGYCEVN
jgi:hypothetical protein